MALPEEDFEVYDSEDSQAQISGVLELFQPGDRVVDLGSGRGRIARPLAEKGVEVLAVDRDQDALAHEHWTKHSQLTTLLEDLLSSEATWFERGPFDGVACLGNTLNLVHDHEDAQTIFQRAFSALAVGGRLLIDDFPIWGPEMIRTEWPLGISPDGAQQVAWSSCGRSFAYRTGSQVDSTRRYPEPGERMLRAWTIGEVEKIALESGFTPCKHDEAALMILFARSD